MVDAFQRLPGGRRTPPGLERRILRLLPKVLFHGSLLLLVPSLLVRLVGEDASAASHLTDQVDFWVLALLFLHWNAVLTVAIGAFIVMVMKGPAYVADPYPMDRRAADGPDHPPH
ncbi:hypothetical protein KAK07_02185 [Ideonella sp. 4Y16]|uniref:Transmembrane protein n=1 Tax=Ideonella alba TaxID=2824118 RepID=A0A940Y806_9BURK|nr:hypothetical protein [Ideonella alba]MBQ0929905.1 hypothetical protein [Ideonella alba]MBQ0942138.1 hypothetical protein [Ideonella alba]